MNIKHKISILTAALSLILVWSCDDSILDKTDPNNLSPETFFETQAQLENATNAIYAGLQANNYYGRQYFFANDLMSQESEGLGSLGGDLREYIDHTWTSSNGNIANFWMVLYQGIHKANFVIGNADRVPDSEITAAWKNQYLGEAHFMRAHYYFEVVTRWGAAPLLTEIATVAEGLPRSPVADIYALIQSDLNFASQNLMTREDLGADRNGRASKGAAFGLKGKVHLFREEWSEAASAFQQVESLGYTLTDNYYDNFMEETEWNSESLFEVQFNEEHGANNAWGANGSGIDEVTWRAQEFGAVGWRNTIPSQDMLDEYEAGDPRYAENFLSDGDSYAGGAHVMSSPDGKPSWRKYGKEYRERPGCCNSGINFRVIRYADVLLMWAEALNEQGQSAQAIAKLNEVRNRPSVSMPNYGTPAMDAIYPVGTQAQIFDAIVHERKVELVGEQVRYRDMQRWGISASIVPNYTVGKHELWPIPLREIDANDAISSADQNPGY